MPQRTHVSSADFIRNIGHWQSEALRHPIAITHHGRERLILASPDQFGRSGEANDAGNDGELARMKAAGAALLENMAEGYIGFDLGMRIATMNTTAEAFTDHALDTMRGATALEAMPEPIGSILSDRIQRVLRTRMPEGFEGGAFDGRNLSFRIFPSAPGVGVLFENTTEEHQLRREREESAALELAARTHEDVSLIKLDARGRIESAQGAFARWTGFAAEDVSGHRLADLAAAGCRRDLLAALERVLREPTALLLRLVLHGKRGEELNGVFSFAPVLSDFIARGVQVIWTLDGEREALRG